MCGSSAAEISRHDIFYRWVHRVHSQYMAAMRRRREYVLPLSNFIEYTARPDVFVWENGADALVGVKYSVPVKAALRDVYHVTHFAPSSFIAMTLWMRRLAQGREWVMFTVTDDLVGMLERCGFQRAYGLEEALDSAGFLPYDKMVLVSKSFNQFAMERAVGDQILFL